MFERTYLMHAFYSNVTCLIAIRNIEIVALSFNPNVRRFKFRETHPGYQFSYLSELKRPTIPRIALPKDKLCALNELELNATNPTENSIGKREVYAKMALMMFYPFRKLSDLTSDKSYWKKFHQERTNPHSSPYI